MKQRKELYEELLQEVESVLDGEKDPIVWMASLSCLIKQKLHFFWVGFYRLAEGQLQVGPYQGTLGCLRIEMDKGVCGTAVARRETVLVPDVHQFPGHIACDTNSESEIVVPVFDREERLRAVLDIDSDKLDDFSPLDQHYLEQLVARMRDIEWTRGS
jgi:L-methionine (R)-S-oxide reductase